MHLSNKIIVITGAAQGLGKTLTDQLTRQGATLALIDFHQELLQETFQTISELSPHSTQHHCDIRNLEQVKEMVKAVIETHGKIDILINDAGVWTDDLLEKERPNLRHTALETNVLGHIQVTEEFLPYFQAQNSGHIFNVISTSGVSDIKDGNNSLWKTYGATKWAMTGYTNALKKALVESRIKVTSFFPGGFESNLYENAGRQDPHDQPWMMRSEDIADIVIFALTRPDDVDIENIVVSKKM